MDAGNRADLTGFAALIGESFQARIDLLEKLLRSRHFPSLGNYKERLLANAIAEYLPKTASVGTGFVMFPCEAASEDRDHSYFDELNQSHFDVSRQCDILVYDSQTHPPVFQDGDFVVLRPESVKAVIEVKGNSRLRDVKSALESFLDFGRKWQNTQKFYRSHHHKSCEDPQLHLFCWSSPARKRSSPGQHLREVVCDFYRQTVSLDEFGSFPMLDCLYVYNEWEISEIQSSKGNPAIHQAGWCSRKGRFLRLDETKKPFLDKDRTVSSLLASLHWAVDSENFNRFFSYADEVRLGKLGEEENFLDFGITWAWETEELEPIRRRNASEAPK